ncbi:MAG: hypothetical protein AABZ06_14360, partial [Bdellovibrionota bacterium]
LLLCLPTPLSASDNIALQHIQAAQGFFSSGQYFKAARYAFAAQEESQDLEADAYSWITVSLVRAGLYQSASYFFIRTLQSGNKTAIKRVLTETEKLLLSVGADILRKYLIRHTEYDDYDAKNRSAYLFSIGKEAVLSGKEREALGYLGGIARGSFLWPKALQLRGTGYAILGDVNNAIRDFKECEDRADELIKLGVGDPLKVRLLKREAADLKARCSAGEARTLYQMDRFDEADVKYDGIPKSSFVWPDILFEQAWNSFGRREYNRSLGKLVSYKSPALSFVFNSEVDVLRAQAYLALCLYHDADGVIDEFNKKYTDLSRQLKLLVEKGGDNMGMFYDFGKQALMAPVYTANGMHRMANRFVRGPYFQDLVASEHTSATELAAVNRLEKMHASEKIGVSGGGFPSFLEQVLSWRVKSVRLLGGAFVKNSLMDYHAVLVSDFDKISFIKYEILKRAKESLIYKNSSSVLDRDRGALAPVRRGYQFFWSFNGEFWNDELGDYVFGLESACGAENAGA